MALVDYQVERTMLDVGEVAHKKTWTTDVVDSVGLALNAHETQHTLTHTHMCFATGRTRQGNKSNSKTEMRGNALHS